MLIFYYFYFLSHANLIQNNLSTFLTKHVTVTKEITFVTWWTKTNIEIVMTQDTNSGKLTILRPRTETGWRRRQLSLLKAYHNDTRYKFRLMKQDSCISFLLHLSHFRFFNIYICNIFSVVTFSAFNSTKESVFNPTMSCGSSCVLENKCRWPQ